jgi:pimeloyl-ACP methyl ester carboxylesterase
MTRRNFLTTIGGAELLIQSGLAASPPDSGVKHEPPGKPYISREFEIRVGDRTITPRMISPRKERLAAHPLLLLTLCGERETALTVHPYAIAAELFLTQGHRVVSFDLPNHGKRVDKYGEGLAGWRNAFVDGKDPLAMSVEEASAIISWCIQAGLADRAKVVVYGISRAGYLGLRLLASDARVTAAAAIAPVTDWGVVAEFADDRKREYLAALNLSRHVDQLAGKPIFTVIGNADNRVGTLSCSRFFVDLLEANTRQGHGTSGIEFACSTMAQTGHTVDDSWRRMGAEFLLKAGKFV